MAKEAKHVVFLLCTINIKNNDQQESAKISNCHYHIQDIKDVQHKNVNMNWGYLKFPRHSVATEKFETGERNTIIFYYHNITGLTQNLVEIFVQLVKCKCIYSLCF